MTLPVTPIVPFRPSMFIPMGTGAADDNLNNSVVGDAAGGDDDNGTGDNFENNPPEEDQPSPTYN